MQCHVSLRFPRGAHDTVACEGFYLGDNVAFAEGVSVCLRGRGFAGMLMMHRPYRSEPIADCIVGVRCHGSLNAATAVVTHYYDVSNAQHIDGDLLCRREIGIILDRKIGNVAMYEHLAGIEVYNFSRGHAAV